jgi:hypothetical protein
LLAARQFAGIPLQFAPTTQSGGSGGAQSLPGLAAAFRFDTDGTARELAVDQPIEPGAGWLWLHFNLATYAPAIC